MKQFPVFRLYLAKTRYAQTKVLEKIVHAGFKVSGGRTRPDTDQYIY